MKGEDHTGKTERGGRLADVLTGAWAALVSRLILGGVFLYAGATKALDDGALAASIRSYELGLPEWFVTFSARGLPLLEILIGLYLVAGLFTRPAALATGALMVVFLAALAQGAARGLQIDCGCFGGGAGESSLTLAAVRDVALISLCLQLYLRAPGKFSLDEKLGLDSGNRGG